MHHPLNFGNNHAIGTLIEQEIWNAYLKHPDQARDLVYEICDFYFNHLA